MSIFLNHVDNFIDHLVCYNNFQLNSRDKFDHFINNLIMRVLSPAFSESSDFRHCHSRQPCDSLQLNGYFQQF